MRKQREDYLTGNLTAMIDIVFQLIIFFVCTIQLQEKAVDDRINLAIAPHGEQVVTKNPLDINVDVDSRGTIMIMRTPITEGMLVAILRKAAADTGVTPPVIIRGDSNTKHAAIKAVMDACARAGIWKIKFAALKEKA